MRLLRRQPATLDRGKDLETHAYAFIHTDDIKARIAELFGDDMQFDVIIGNPPVPARRWGLRKEARPIYQHFVEQAKKLDPRLLSMVIPSRWFAGGKGLDEFREAMLDDQRVRSIDDYLSGSDVFPGIGLKGGVCYFLWDRDNPGLCNVSTHFTGHESPRHATPPGTRRGRVHPIQQRRVDSQEGRLQSRRRATGSLGLPEQKRSALVSHGSHSASIAPSAGKRKASPDDLKVYQNGGHGYISRSDQPGPTDRQVEAIRRSAAPGTGNKDAYPHRILSTRSSVSPGRFLRTYMCIGPFDSRARLERHIVCFLPLTRLLILLHKPSQDTTRRVYTFVPPRIGLIPGVTRTSTPSTDRRR